MQQVVKYDVTEAAISEMRSLYMELTVKGIDDQEGFEQVHSARMVVKGKRVLVEKQRKEYKADALEFGRKVDAEAKKIFSLLEPIESHLQQQEDVVINERKRVQAEKEQAEQKRILGRINELASVDCILSYFDVSSLSDPEYEKLFAEKKDAFEAERARQAEAARIETERLEADRLAREAEAKRLAVERAELDRIRREQEAEKAKLEAEKKAIEEAARKERERTEREAFEKQAIENARIAAEKAAKDKTEREAREKAEAEQRDKEEAERQEALAPDKDKLFTFANRLFKFKNDTIPTLPFGSPAVPILSKAEMAIDKVIKTLLKEAKEL